MPKNELLAKIGLDKPEPPKNPSDRSFEDLVQLGKEDRAIRPQSQFTGYGELGKFDKGLVPGIGFQENRAFNQPLVSKIGRTVGNLPFNIAGSLVEGAGFLGELAHYGMKELADVEYKADFTNALTEFANENIKDPFGEAHRRNNEVFDLGDWSWWLNNGSGLVESIASFAMMGAGVGKVASTGAKGLATLLNNSMKSSKAIRLGTSVINAGAQGITSATLGYLEGAMSGAEVYKKAIEEGSTVKEASEAAAKTVKLNTALIGALNVTSVFPLFRANQHLKRAEKFGLNRKAGETSKDFAQRMKQFQKEPNPATKSFYDKVAIPLEGVQESVEELANLYSEIKGEQLAGISDTDATGFDLIKEIVTSEEGVLSAILGAVGGIGNTFAMRNMPFHRTDVSEEGEPAEMRYLSHNKLEKMQDEQMGIQYAKALEKDIRDVIKYQDELKTAIDSKDDVAIDLAKNKLFDVATKRSIPIDGGEAIKASLLEMSEVDNETDLGQHAQEQLNELNQLPAEEVTPEIEEQKQILEQQAKDLLGVTEAMDLGLAVSMEDNEYKEKAIKKSNEIDELAQEYEDTLAKYNYGDEQTLGLGEYVFDLNLRRRRAKENIEDLGNLSTKINNSIKEVQEDVLPDDLKNEEGNYLDIYGIQARETALAETLTELEKELKQVGGPRSKELQDKYKSLNDNQVKKEIQRSIDDTKKELVETTSTLLEFAPALIKSAKETASGMMDLKAIERSKIQQEKQLKTLNRRYNYIDSASGRKDFVKHASNALDSEQAKQEKIKKDIEKKQAREDEKKKVEEVRKSKQEKEDKKKAQKKEEKTDKKEPKKEPTKEPTKEDKTPVEKTPTPKEDDVVEKTKTPEPSETQTTEKPSKTNPLEEFVKEQEEKGEQTQEEEDADDIEGVAGDKDPDVVKKEQTSNSVSKPIELIDGIEEIIRKKDGSKTDDFNAKAVSANKVQYGSASAYEEVEVNGEIVKRTVPDGVRRDNELHDVRVQSKRPDKSLKGKEIILTVEPDYEGDRVGGDFDPKDPMQVPIRITLAETGETIGYLPTMSWVSRTDDAGQYVNIADFALENGFSNAEIQKSRLSNIRNSVFEKGSTRSEISEISTGMPIYNRDSAGRKQLGSMAELIPEDVELSVVRGGSIELNSEVTTVNAGEGAIFANLGGIPVPMWINKLSVQDENTIVAAIEAVYTENEELINQFADAVDELSDADYTFRTTDGFYKFISERIFLQNFKGVESGSDVLVNIDDRTGHIYITRPNDGAVYTTRPDRIDNQKYFPLIGEDGKMVQEARDYIGGDPDRGLEPLNSQISATRLNSEGEYTDIYFDVEDGTVKSKTYPNYNAYAKTKLSTYIDGRNTIDHTPEAFEEDKDLEHIYFENPVLYFNTYTAINDGVETSEEQQPVDSDTEEVSTEVEETETNYKNSLESIENLFSDVNNYTINEDNSVSVGDYKIVGYDFKNPPRDAIVLFNFEHESEVLWQAKEKKTLDSGKATYFNDFANDIYQQLTGNIQEFFDESVAKEQGYTLEDLTITEFLKDAGIEEVTEEVTQENFKVSPAKRQGNLFDLENQFNEVSTNSSKDSNEHGMPLDSDSTTDEELENLIEHLRANAYTIKGFTQEQITEVTDVMTMIIQNTMQDENGNYPTIAEVKEGTREKFKQHYWHLRDNNLPLEEVFRNILFNFDSFYNETVKHLKSMGFEQTTEGMIGEDVNDEKKAYEEKARWRENSKDTASSRLKMFMATIPRKRWTENAEGEQILESEKSSWLGLDRYVPMDEIWDKLTTTLVDLDPDIDNYKAVLEEASKDYAPFKVLLNKLDNLGDSSAIESEFVKVMSKQYLNLMLSLIEPKYNDQGEVDYYLFKPIDSDRNSVTDMILASWMNSFKDSSLVKERDGNLYIVAEEAKKIKQKYIDAVDGMANPYQNKAAIVELLNDIGVEIDAKQLDKIAKAKKIFGDTGDIRSHFKVKDGEAVNNTFLGILFSSLNTEEDTLYEANNPYSLLKSRFRKMAFYKSLGDEKVYTDGFNDINGNRIYPYQMNTSFSTRIHKLKNDKAYVSRLKKLSFHKNSKWLNKPEDVEIKYIDGLKNQKTKIGNSGEQLGRDNADLMALTMFFGTVGQTGGKQGLYHTLTKSDKTTYPMIKAPRHKVVVNVEENKAWFTGQTRKYIKDIIQAEYSRIYKFKNGVENQFKESGMALDGYMEGANHFIMLPELNAEIAETYVGKAITQEEFESVYKADEPFLKGTTENSDNTLNVLYKIVERRLVDEIEEARQRFSNLGIMDSLPANYKNQIPSSLPDDFVATTDFIVNQFFAMSEEMMTLSGDPAKFWKESKKDNATIRDHIQTTIENMSKRLAKDIAPRSDGNYAKDERSIRMVTIEDMELASLHKELTHDVYQKMPITDAQEFTTVKEHLVVLKAEGKITPKKFNELMKVVNKGGNYKFTPEQLGTIFTPVKPLYTGETLLPNSFDVEVTTYVKSSAVPLVPQLLKGTELDKLRKYMEESKVDRAAFKSAVKVGAINPVKLFEDRKIVNTNPFKDSVSIREIDRKGFGIQQEVPVKDKTEINVLSQANKLLFLGLRDTEGFKFLGKNYKGSELETIKENIRKGILKKSEKELRDRLSIKYDDNSEKLVFSNINKVRKVLLKEADKRGWNINGIESLRLNEDRDGFVIPLSLSPNSGAIESLIMSLVTNITRGVKVPGYSYVQNSSAGILTMQESGLKNSEITPTRGYDSTRGLKFIEQTKEGTTPAQIFVPWRFKDGEGNPLDIKDFIDKDGYIIDEKLPPEARRLIGARIPTQGHNSMIPLEIAGFLPEYMGTSAIVPEEIVAQMGSDFDIDKLYTYAYDLNYDEEKGTLTKPKVTLPDDGNFDKYSIDYLNKLYIEMFESVLTHRDAYDKLKSPLDKPDLEDERDLINEASATDTLRAPNSYLGQIDYRLNQKAAQRLIGVFARANTLNAILENGRNDIGLVETITTDEGKEQVPVHIPVSVDGKQFSLSKLSGSATTTYNGEERTKGDNISLLISAAVDNANLNILGAIGANEHTAGIIATMAMSQSEDGEALNLPWIARFMSQPVIKDVVREIESLDIATSSNFYSREEKVEMAINTVREKYAEGVEDFKGVSIDEGKMGGYLGRSLESLNSTAINFQLNVLDVFEKFVPISQEVKDLQDIVLKPATDGIDNRPIYAMEQILKYREADKNFKNLSNITSLFHNPDLSLTEQGTAMNVIYNNADTFITELLPEYNRMMILKKPLESEILLKKLSTKNTETLWKAMKEYNNVSPNIKGMEDIQGLRQRLLFGTEEEAPLADRVEEAKNTWAKNDYFIKRLERIIPDDPKQPRTIEFRADKMIRMDDNKNSASIVSSLISEDPKRRKLMEDLVLYNLMNGGVQGPVQFSKYIPPAYLDYIGLKGGALQMNISQLVQHNPELATSLEGNEEAISEEVKDGIILKSPYELSRLPIIKIVEDSPTYPSFITKYDAKKGVKLFTASNILQNGTVLFKEIPVLGNSNASEYVRGAGKNIQSIYNENISNEVQETTNNPPEEMSPELQAIEELEKQKDSEIQSELDTNRGMGESDPKIRKIKDYYDEKINSIKNKADSYSPTIPTRSPEFTKPSKPYLGRLEPYLSKDMINNKGGNLNELLNSIDFKENRELATLLKKYLGDDVEFAFGRTNIQGQEVLGKFNVNENKVYLNIEAIDESSSSLHQVILHEVVHAVTVKSIQEGDTKETEKINTLLGTVKRALRDKGTDVKYDYQLSSVEEFVSAVFTEPNFQHELNSIKFNNSNALARFMSLVKDLIASLAKNFGIEVEENSALETAINEGVNLMQTLANYVPPTDIDDSGIVEKSNRSGARGGISLGMPIQKDPVLEKLAESLRSRISTINKKISSTKDAEKVQALKNARERLNKDYTTLISEGTASAITEVANSQVQWAEAILESDDISESMYETVKNVLYSWDYEATRNFLHPVQLKTSNPIKTALLDADALVKPLKGKFDVRLMEDLRNNVNKTLPQEYQLKTHDMMFMEDIGIPTQYMLDLSMVDNRLAQYIYKTVVTAARSAGDTLNKYYDELQEASEGITDFDVFKQVDEEGNFTGNFIDEYSEKYYREKSIIVKTFYRDLYKVNELKEDVQSKAISNTVKRYHEAINKIDAVVDTRMLVLDNYQSPLYKSKEEYVSYLEEQYGEDKAHAMIAEAESMYNEYLRRKDFFEESLDAEYLIEKDNTELSREDWKANKLKEYENTHNPLRALDERLGTLDGKIDTYTAKDANDFLVSVPRATINGENSGYLDDNFKNLTEEEQKFYEFYINSIDQFKSYLPQYKAREIQKNFLPTLTKSMAEQFSTGGTKAGLRYVNGRMVDAFTTGKSKELNNKEEISFKERDAFTGKPKNELLGKKAEFMLSKDAIDPNDRSFDIPSLLQQFAAVSINFKYMNDIEDKANLALHVMRQASAVEKKNGVPKKDTAGNLVENREGVVKLTEATEYFLEAMLYGKRTAEHKASDIAIFDSWNIRENNEKRKRMKELEKERDDLESLMQSRQIPADVYDTEMTALEEEYRELGGKNLVWAKVGESFLKFTQLKGMGYNLTAGMANVGFGFASALVWSASGKDFTGKDLMNGFRLVLHSLKPGSSENSTKYKIANLIRHFDVLFEVTEVEYGQDPDNAQRKKKKKYDFVAKNLHPYQIQRRTEYYVQGMSLVAQMLNTTVDVKNLETGKEETISLYEAFGNDGNWNSEKYEKRSDWTTPETGSESNEFTNFRDKVIQVNKYLHGNYDPKSPLLVKKTLVGKAAMMFRSWMPMGFAQRFKGEFYDAQLGREFKGRYRSFLDIGLVDTLKVMTAGTLGFSNQVIGKKGEEKFSEVDADNLRMNIREMQSLIGIIAIGIALKASIDDDDEESSYVAHILTNQLYRVEQDIYFYINPATFEEITRNPFPVFKTFNDFIKVAEASMDYITDDEYEDGKLSKAWGRAMPFANQLIKTDYLGTNIIDN